MQWYCVTLTPREFVAGKHLQLQHEFAKEWITSGIPRGAAMYGSTATSSDYHFYFTPNAARIAKALLKNYNAVECDEPDLQGLTPLVVNSA